MLLERGDGTFDGGSLDVICILHDINTGKYHAAFFEEHPLPGQSDIPMNELTAIRLRSKMHHTGGADTLDGALEHVNDLKAKIRVSKENVWLEPKDWDGEPAITWVVPRW